MAEITLPSGKVAVINIADFEDGMRLQNRLIKEAAKEGVKDFDVKKLLGAFQTGNIMGADIDVNAILMAAIGAATSDSVYEAIWPCLKKSSYDGERITRATFDAEGARGDFYPIAIECCKVNLSPFWRPLLSELNGAESPAP